MFLCLCDKISSASKSCHILYPFVQTQMLVKAYRMLPVDHSLRLRSHLATEDSSTSVEKGKFAERLSRILRVVLHWYIDTVDCLVLLVIVQKKLRPLRSSAFCIYF